MLHDLEVEMSATLRDLERKVADKIMQQQKGEVFAMTEATRPEIKPCESRGSFLQHEIDAEGISISDTLGFQSNVDEPDGYGGSWAFTVDGEFCHVWFRSPWSRQAHAYGPKEKLELVFGKARVS